jgi:hexosaminidase
MSATRAGTLLQHRALTRVICLFCATLLTACAAAPRRFPTRVSRPAAAYAWRGISLDVARTYFPPATIRRFITLAAHYGLNTVHLHLTDNEAWRLPTPRYPRMASAQHYTRTQIGDLVAYARARGITLVPEIDVPAHAAAAIRAYPELACGSTDTLCPQKAARFAFDAVDGAMDLFPGRYIHTGGDEVAGWSDRQRTRFERSLDAHVRKRQRTMVVWDDEADAAPPDAIVEVWHLGDAASRARRRGHLVVAANDGPLYFDAVQGSAAQEPHGTRYMSTLEEVYAFTPPQHAFGIEGVLWSEYIMNETQLWYALLPREIALGAVANMGKHKIPWPRFRDTVLPREFSWLLANAYGFRIPNTLMSAGGTHVRYAGVRGNQDAAQAFTSDRRALVTLRSLVPHARVFYRTAEETSWRRYVAPFYINLDRDRRVDARTLLANGRAGAVTSLYLRMSLHPHGSLAFDNIVSP